jgi:hypothetical protein
MKNRRDKFQPRAQAKERNLHSRLNGIPSLNEISAILTLAAASLLSFEAKKENGREKLPAVS